MMANKNKCGVYKEFLTLNSKKKKEEEEEEPKLKMSKRPEQTPHQIRDTDDRQTYEKILNVIYYWEIAS